MAALKPFAPSILQGTGFLHRKAVRSFAKLRCAPNQRSVCPDRTRKFPQRLQPQCLGPESLGACTFRSRHKGHCHHHLCRRADILQRYNGVGMFRTVLTPPERIAFNLNQIERDPRQTSRWECCVSLKRVFNPIHRPHKSIAVVVEKHRAIRCDHVKHPVTPRAQINAGGPARKSILPPSPGQGNRVDPCPPDHCNRSHNDPFNDHHAVTITAHSASPCA